MKIKYFISTSALLLIQLLSVADPAVNPGKEIFTTRCAACHNVNKNLTGPALAGVDQRRTIDWIVNFIHSPQKIIKGGDPYAMALFNKFNNITMPDHLDLKTDDIKSIIDYIKSETKNVSAEKPPFTRPGKLRPSYLPLSISENYLFFICFLAFVGVLIGVMLFAVDVKSIQRNKLSDAKNV